MLRNITIQPVLNGYIVNVGCQTVVFSSRDEMFREMGAYLADSHTTEKHYRETALNKQLLTIPAQAPVANIATAAIDALVTRAPHVTAPPPPSAPNI